MLDNYKFSDFNDYSSIVDKIKTLEKEISTSVGHEVILLAYEKTNQ